MFGHAPVGLPSAVRSSWRRSMGLAIDPKGPTPLPRFRVPEADLLPRPPKFVTINGEAFEIVWDGA